MKLSSQIEEKEKTLTELMARILNEPLRPLAESLQQTGVEIKNVKASLKGIAERMEDTFDEAESGNNLSQESKQLLAGVRGQDMAFIKAALTEIQITHTELEATLKALEPRLDGTEKTFKHLTRIVQEGQESIRVQYLALQAEQQAGSQYMVGAFARHTAYCERANKAMLASLDQSTIDQTRRIDALHSHVANVVDQTRQLRQHASEEGKKSREEMASISERQAVQEAHLGSARTSLRRITPVLYVALACLVVLIGLQIGQLLQV
ncbi:MAG: hypothetical protein ITG07_16210 [Candidimonas sp.]|nr:hypothetical protein [Candidimonas sp.]